MPFNDHTLYAQAATQTVAATSSSTQSTSFSDGLTVLRLTSTVNCHIARGPNPTASSADMYLPVGTVEYFHVGQTDKLAVIRDGSTDGTLYITVMV